MYVRWDHPACRPKLLFPDIIHIKTAVSTYPQGFSRETNSMYPFVPQILIQRIVTKTRNHCLCSCIYSSNTSLRGGHPNNIPAGVLYHIGHVIAEYAML